MKFYTLICFIFCVFSGFSQLDLPVTFELGTESLVDFGGNASQIIVDPTDAGNMVAESIKAMDAAAWAGTTIDVGFNDPINFSEGETSMTVRVWSPLAGIPIRLKVEAANDPTISVETSTVVTTAMVWETLTFDFSNQANGTAEINFANQYDKASIFFNFDTDGATSGEQTYYWDDVIFLGEGNTGGGKDQIDLPVTFQDTATVDYTLTDFGESVSQVTVDPLDASNLVAMSIKPTNAPLWAGVTIGTPAGFASAIPFTSEDTKITVMVFSPDANIPVRLKAEAAADPTISVETETMTTASNAWELMEFDFAQHVDGTAALNTSNMYSKLSIFFNFGTDGATAGEKIYHFDNVEFVGGGGGGKDQIDLPVTFQDTATVDYTLTDFGESVSQVTVDPLDASNLVAMSIKPINAPLWAGVTIGTPAGFASAIPFTSEDTKITVMVFSPDANIPVRLKAEAAADPTISVETETMTTASNAWELMEFDFAQHVDGTAALNTSNMYSKLSIFFNFGTDGATAGEKIYYFDNVEFVGGGGGGKDQIDLPVTFQDTATVDYTLTDFGESVSQVTVDPLDASNLVAMSIKPINAPLWAGVTIGTPAGFASAIPFTSEDTKITVMVFSPDANIPVRLKAEAAADPTISVETETMTTASNAWELMEFDFAQHVDGTAALNTSNMYSKLSIFFNFGTDGATAGEKIYYFDNLEFVGGGGGGKDQIDLPLSFEDPDNIDYTLTDFGDGISQVVQDPTDPNNTVAMTIKPEIAPVWAGVTMGTSAGFASEIPFDEGKTTMSVRVFSPIIGSRVLLKVENAANGSLSTETSGFTTVANAWETMIFDLANNDDGTPALDFNVVYDKASIFFNFGTDGATAGELTYYWDDVEFNSLLSTDNVSIDGLTYYPNPVTDRLLLSADLDIKLVEIYNVMGASVDQINDVQINEINMEALPTGMYLIQLYTEQGSGVIKVMKN